MLSAIYTSKRQLDDFKDIYGTKIIFKKSPLNIFWICMLCGINFSILENIVLHTINFILHFILQENIFFLNYNTICSTHCNNSVINNILSAKHEKYI